MDAIPAIGAEVDFVQLAADADISVLDKRRMHVCLGKLRLHNTLGELSVRWRGAGNTDYVKAGRVVVGEVLDAPPRLRIFQVHDAARWNRITAKLASNRSCTACGRIGFDARDSNCPCGLAQYCSKACQTTDWRTGGHKAVHKAATSCTAPAAAAQAVLEGVTSAQTPLLGFSCDDGRVTEDILRMELRVAAAFLMHQHGTPEARIAYSQQQIEAATRATPEHERCWRQYCRGRGIPEGDEHDLDWLVASIACKWQLLAAGCVPSEVMAEVQQALRA